ncbi:MAG: metal-dependent hydrolase [Leptospira sp.]|nr:metal-dependent hydrolase [Leptospira sp.]
MTPIEHAGCGLATGGILAPGINRIFKVPYWTQDSICVIGAVSPDLDALTLLFNHSVYYGKLWYSHHIFFHSIFAGFLFGIFVSAFYVISATILRGFRNLFRKEKVILEHRTRKFTGVFLISVTGYCVHFLGDLPTPAGPWGGIALFWPSTKMSGGWSRIYWHNWYLIYISIVFFISFSIVAILAGALSAIPVKFIKWTGYFLRILTFIFSLVFSYEVYSFIDKHNFKEMGFQKWDSFNRSLVPKQYIKNADEYRYRATIFWRKQIFSWDDFLLYYNKTLKTFEQVHENYFSSIGNLVPREFPLQSELDQYKFYQSLAKGMEDGKEGDFRIWFLRLSYPSPEFFNKGFVLYYNSGKKNYYLQMSNSLMVGFRIEERDPAGNATKVKKVIHTDKVFVPDKEWPQLNIEKLKERSLNFWDHDRIAYNLIPRRGISRFGNILHGLYPSLNTIPGFVHPGIDSGIAIHDGLYSEGCTVHTFGHTELGSHLQYPYYPLWKSANEIIDIDKPGSRFRGKRKIWGRVVFIKNLPDV